MKIFNCRSSDGRQIPILFRLSPCQPLLVPFLFVTLKRQYKAFNTVRNDLIAIKAFYEFHELKGIDVDEAMITGKLPMLMKSIEQFVGWLSIDRKAENVVGRIGNTALGRHRGMTPSSRDGYLKSLKLFFAWCAQRYATANAQTVDLENSFTSSQSSIASRFDSYLVTPSTRQVNFKSLSEVEIAMIREISHLRDQVSLREIAKRLGISRNTVRRYLRSETLEPSYASRASPSVLDKYALKLSAWLKTEAAKSRKQRRTLKQMHIDLCALGFEGSYDRVAAFARQWRLDQLERVNSASKGTI